MQEVAFAVSELRRLDDERRADERAAIERERARVLAEASARELTERIARVEAEAAVAREAHAAERARLELELARLRAMPAPAVAPVIVPAAPVRLAPLWIAIVATAVCAIGAAWWSAGRIDDAQRRADALLDRLRTDLGQEIDARPAPVVVNVPATAPIAAAAVAPAPTRPAPAHPAPTHVAPSAAPRITVCGDGSPLGCLPHP